MPRPTPVVPKMNVVTITVDFYDFNPRAFVAGFIDQLTQVLRDNGIDDAAIQIVGGIVSTPNGDR